MEFEEFKIINEENNTSSSSFSNTLSAEIDYRHSSNEQDSNYNQHYSPQSKTDKLFSQTNSPTYIHKLEINPNIHEQCGLLYLQQACFFLDPQMEMDQAKLKSNLIANKENQSYQSDVRFYGRMETTQPSTQSQQCLKINKANYYKNAINEELQCNNNGNNDINSVKVIEEEEDQDSSSSSSQPLHSQLQVIKQKDLSYQLISTFRLQQHDLFELFCDIPFSLDYYNKEINNEVLPQRNCIYNSFKKVMEVRSFYNGMMIDTSLESIFSAQNKFDYLIKLLESKGNSQFFDLANRIKNFQQRVNKVNEEASQISNQIYLTESKKLFYYEEEKEKQCSCSIYKQDCNCNYKKESNSKMELENDNQNSMNMDSSVDLAPKIFDKRFLEDRQKASAIVKERILASKNPLDYIYFKTYSIDWNNQGNLKLDGYGFSKGYCELMGLTIAEYKQLILRKGFMENLNYDCKVKFMFPFFAQFPWSVKGEIVSKVNPMIFTTYDNIIFKGRTIVEVHNLTYEFDKKHNFFTDLCNILLFIKVEANHEDLRNVFSVRRQRGTRSILDDKDDEECDFYYSKESQSFLERYYKDIYGPKYAEKKQLRRCEYIEIPQQQNNQQIYSNPFNEQKN